MKMLNTPQEIAVAINMHQMPVVRLDLADADEYGIKSQKVLIDNGKFKRLKPTDPDMPYLVRAEIRAFVDKKKFTLASHAIEADSPHRSNYPQGDWCTQAHNPDSAYVFAPANNHHTYCRRLQTAQKYVCVFPI